MRIRKFLALILAICLTVTLFPGSQPVAARAASSDEIRDEIDELEKQEQQLQAQIDELEKQRDENAHQIQEIAAQKQIIDQQITLINQQVLVLQQQIAALRVLIADKQEQYEQALANYVALNEQYKARIRTMEEQGELSYWSILFHANSFSDFLDRINMIGEIAAADRRRMEQLSAAASQVEDARKALEAEQEALQTSLSELETAQAVLEEKRQEADVLLQQLAAQGAEFERLLDESEQAQQELLEQIAQKEDEFDKAAYEEWLAANPPSTGGGSQPPVSSSGWVVPVPYYTLSSPFGMRWHPVYGDYRMHYGIDMACAAMTPIYASRGGQVEIAKYSDTAGNYVQINHGDGYRSVYMHMTYYTVSVGQYVTAGQIIGYVGNTGVSKGAHLHFGISYNGEYINPYPFISGGN